MACHFYYDQEKGLPAPKLIIQDGDNLRDSTLSWRVTILPFLIEDLFGEFDFTSSWDKGRNAALQLRMPPIYTSRFQGGDTTTGTTHFQYAVGPDTLFPDNRSPAFRDIPDGLSRTILFAEADQPVVWTRAADMNIQLDQPLPFPQRFFAAMADGTVRNFSREVSSDAVLRQLINPNDKLPDHAGD